MNDTDTFAAILDIRDTVTRTEAKVDAHLQNLSIHQQQPCEYAQKISRRMWGFVIACLTAVIGALGSIAYAMIGH